MMRKSNLLIEGHLEKFFELSLDMLCIANAQGYFLHVNPAFSRTLGYTSEELLSKPIIDFVHPDDRQPTQTVLDDIDDGTEAVTAFENRYICADGSIKWLSWNSTTSTDNPDLVYAIARDITAQKQHAQHLEKTRTILESISDAFFALDSNWHFTYINTEAERLLFRERNDLIGKSVWEEFPEAIDSTFYTQYHLCAEEQVPVTFIEYYPPLQTWFQVHAYPAENNAISVYFRDISEQKRMEAQLQEAVNTLEQRVAERTDALSRANDELRRQIAEREEAQEARSRLVDILEATSDLVSIANVDGKLVYLNHAGRRTMGFDPEADLSNVYVRDTIPRWAYKLILAEGLPTAMETGIWRGETALLASDGDEVPLSQVVITHMDDDDKLQFVSTVARDITDLKRIEQDLRDALEIEKELNELKTRFVTMVSHEFRTPLAAIQSAADIMERYGDRLSPERITQYFGQIRRQVRHLTLLMEGVLTISRAQSLGLDFEPQSMDVVAFSHNIIDEIDLITNKQAQVVFKVNGTPRTIKADDMLLRQILTNLLSNAIKYSPDKDMVWFDLTFKPDHIIFKITDHGIGIPEEDQKHLFEIFHRADNVGTIQGTGIGLAIVWQALKTHNGTIDLKSVEHQGTTITVTIPTLD